MGVHDGIQRGGGRRGALGVIGAVVFVAASLLVGGPATALTEGPAAGLRTAGPLRDLQPSANPTDGAFAQFAATTSGNSTTAYFVINGLNPAAAGEVHGAHVHTGPCVAGNGAAAGPHFRVGTTATPSTEVWLDFTIQPNGSGYASTTVPFTIAPGTAQSVVIHAAPTQPGGAAGDRIACLPVPF
jgi:Cu/Zn superoxide dismutase